MQQRVSGAGNTADKKQKGLLRRLARDSRGNTLAMVAAGLVPLAAMIGSGIDMSRAYMAKTRLQGACDAAALAARRVMTNDTMSPAVTAEAIRFFNFNFPQRTYQTAAFTPVVTKPESGTIHIDADTTIPTVIMNMFGYGSMPLKVSCDASQNFVNTDIILVLDTTGSMLCATTETSCTNSTEKDTSKIKALREAVLALYDELRPIQTELESNGLRLRFGVVPYSSGVNVGKLIRAESPDYMQTGTRNYFSRRAIFEIDSPRRQSDIRRGTCDDRENWTWVQTSGSGDYALGTCNYTVKVESYTGTRDQFKEWDYGQTPIDITNYVTGAATATPTREPGTTSNSTWAGCIEERQTVDTISSSSGYSIPSGANDLNINLIPTSSAATKWKPYWPEIAYRPDSGDRTNIASNGNRPQVACPTGSKLLQAWQKTDLSNYLNTLVPTGGTYHDNGMIWGTRLISSGGIFGAKNPDTFNGMPVAKHIIFMTDGILDTGNTIYSTYGMEYWDERVTGGWSTQADQDGRHDQRYKMMCNAAKGMPNVSIWVVAFASELTTSLSDCASNAAQASVSEDKAKLIAKFTEIGKNIGALRLTQ